MLEISHQKLRMECRDDTLSGTQKRIVSINQINSPLVALQCILRPINPLHIPSQQSHLPPNVRSLESKLLWRKVQHHNNFVLPKSLRKRESLLVLHIQSLEFTVDEKILIFFPG